MRARRLTTFAVAIVAVVGLAGGCGGSEPDRATTGTGTSPLAFTSPAIGGGSIDGAAFQGRPALLWFWSPW